MPTNFQNSRKYLRLLIPIHPMKSGLCMVHTATTLILCCLTKYPNPKSKYKYFLAKMKPNVQNANPTMLQHAAHPTPFRPPARRSLTPLSAVKPSARKSRDDNNIAAVCAVQTFLVHQTKNRIPTPHAERDKKKLKIINHAS